MVDAYVSDHSHPHNPEPSSTFGESDHAAQPCLRWRDHRRVRVFVCRGVDRWVRCSLHGSSRTKTSKSTLNFRTSHVVSNPNKLEELLFQCASRCIKRLGVCVVASIWNQLRRSEMIFQRRTDEIVSARMRRGRGKEERGKSERDEKQINKWRWWDSISDRSFQRLINTKPNDVSPTRSAVGWWCCLRFLLEETSTHLFDAL